nr:integrase, catalytic region, zinc finger, CCHC-type, peptidase aspartic, catalytic [Tanacetum cinerariifolium]
MAAAVTAIIIYTLPPHQHHHPPGAFGCGSTTGACGFVTDSGCVCGCSWQPHRVRFVVMKHQQVRLDLGYRQIRECLVEFNEIRVRLVQGSRAGHCKLNNGPYEYAKLWNDWYEKCDECKFDKISYDKAYKDMQQKIERLQAQLGDLKGKSKDTSCVSDTLNPLSQKLENENVELEFQHVPNNVRSSARIKPIIVSQPPVITKKDVNSDSNGLSSTGIDNTKTRRPQPRSNTKNDRVPSASKSSQSKNKGVEIEEHHKNLLFSKNTKHMSSTCNNITLDSQNVISKVVCAMSIATACFTENRSIIHCRFNKTPYEIINGRKPKISFLYAFGALCYPKNDHEDIGKLGAKGNIGFFISYSADSCAYRFYNRRTKKIMETMNVSFDELSAMAFKQRSSKPELQSMTLGQISSGLDLTYAPSTITTQQPTEDELDLLFEAMHDDFISGQPSAAQRTVPASQAQQDVDELNSHQQHVQQQGNQAHLQFEIIADNVPNAMFDGNTFVNPFANPSTSVAESSSS